MLVERTNFPTFVSRSVSGNRLPSASRSSVIVLNLMILKILASLPGLSCRKSSLPQTPPSREGLPLPFAIKSKIEIMSSIGDMQMSAISAIQKSKNRFKKSLYICYCFYFLQISIHHNLSIKLDFYFFSTILSHQNFLTIW